MFEKAQGLLNIKSLILNNMDDWSVNELKKKQDFFFPFTLNIFRKLREEWANYAKNALKYLMNKNQTLLIYAHKVHGHIEKHLSRCVKIEQGCIYFTAWNALMGKILW